VVTKVRAQLPPHAEELSTKRKAMGHTAAAAAPVETASLLKDQRTHEEGTRASSKMGKRARSSASSNAVGVRSSQTRVDDFFTIDHALRPL
jgi:hypothetical protein